MISRSTVSGDAPGYGTFTTITGCCTSGIWLTRRFLNASNPTHMSTMTIATVVTGCLMLKLDRNMRGSLGLLAAGSERSACHLHRLAVHQRRGRILENRVALGDAALHHELAAARITIAHVEVHLLQGAALHPPRESRIALANERRGRKGQRRRVARFD